MARYENIHGLCILAGHTFAAADLPEQSLWIPADGTLRRIRLDSIDVPRQEVKYTDLGNGRSFERDSFGFQCRYCLVVNDAQQYAHLLDASVRGSVPVLD